MKLGIAGIALCAGLAGCSWFQGPGATTVATSAGVVASCVLGQIEQGQQDPTAIVAACSGAALDDVVSIVESLISFYLTSDGGVPPATMAQLRNLAAAGHAKMGH